jgi:hypothetical protein
LISSSNAKGKKEVGSFSGTIDNEYFDYTKHLIHTIAQIGGDEMQDALIWAISNEDFDEILTNDLSFGLRVIALNCLNDYLNIKTTNLLKELLKADQNFDLVYHTLRLIQGCKIYEMVYDLIDFANNKIEIEEKDICQGSGLSDNLSITMHILEEFYINLENSETKDRIKKLSEKIKNANKNLKNSLTN